jgi:tetratricopeptide (TPR) repeat protein
VLTIALWDPAGLARAQDTLERFEASVPVPGPVARAVEHTSASSEARRFDRAGFVAQGYFARAWRRIERGEFDRALTDFERGLALDPSRRDAALARARLLARLGRARDAGAAFEQWLDTASNEAPEQRRAVVLELVEVLADGGQPRAALDVLDRYDGLSIEDSRLMDWRIELLSRLADSPKLIEALELRSRSAGATPAAQIADLDRAVTLATELGAWPRAIELLEAMTGRPGAPPTGRRRALIHERAGDRRAALETWQEVLDHASDRSDRLGIIDTMIAQARALQDRGIEGRLLTQAVDESGRAAHRLADLAAFADRSGDWGRARALTVELAEMTGTRADRALAFERIVKNHSPRVDEPAWLDRLDRLAAVHADFALRGRIAVRHLDEGREGHALQILEALAHQAPPPERRRAWLALAEIQGRRDEPIARARALLEAARLPGEPSVAESAQIDALVVLGRLSEAITRLEKGLQAAPDEPQVLRRLIDLVRQTGDSERVLALYQRLASTPRLGPIEQALAHREAAELARRAPEGLEVALIHYRRAIDLDPADPAPRRSLAEALAGMGLDHEAGEAFADAHLRSGDPMHALRALRLKGPEPLLVDRIERELAHWPDSMRARYWRLRGDHHVDTAEYGRAIRAWTRAIEAHPDPELDRALRRLRAFVARTQAGEAEREGRFVDAVAHWEAAERDLPEAEAAAGLGQALLRLGEPARAARAFARAREYSDPPSAQLLGDLGYAHLRAGERAQARSAFVQAIDRIQQDSALGAEALAIPWSAEDNTVTLQFGPRAGLIEALRAEVAEIDRPNARVALWHTWRARGRIDGTALTSGRPVEGGASTAPGSGGGIEWAYREPRPDGPGRQPIEWFARLLWSLEPDAHRIDRSSTQLGLGVRRLLATPGELWVSAERLVGVGEDASDDWLVRTSWSTRWGLADREQTGWQGAALADAGYLIDREQGLFYGEIRHGIALQLNSRAWLKPHAIVHGRGLQPDPSREAWLEAGVGLEIDLKARVDPVPWAPVRSTGIVRRVRGLDGAGRTGWTVGVSIQW